MRRLFGLVPLIAILVLAARPVSAQAVVQDIGGTQLLYSGPANPRAIAFVFAGGDGVFEDAAVIVVHGGDDDSVDIFAIENAAVVAGSIDAGVVDVLAGGGDLADHRAGLRDMR